MSRLRWVLLVGLAIALVVAGVLLARADDPPRAQPSEADATGTASASPSPSPSPQAPEPVVLAVSVDGLNPDALTQLGRDELPTLWRLIDEGASTLNARTAVELTITLPNHTGMVTGRPVEGAGGHSVTFNDDNLSTLADVHGSYAASMFDVAHDAGVPTALFAEKDKFRFLVRSFDGDHGAPDTTGPDDGTDKIDVADIGSADAITDEVAATLTDGDARLVFWHLASPDAAGHATGWLSPTYLDAVRRVDRQLAEVVDAIESDPARRAATTVLLTADHGGAEGAVQHDRSDVAADYTVPFVAWGNGVRAGADLYDLNADRSDPGTDRPGYAGPQPVRNLDVADTALALLGLDRTPRGTDEQPAPVAVD